MVPCHRLLRPHRPAAALKCGAGNRIFLLLALLWAASAWGCAGRSDPYGSQAIRAQEASLKGQEFLNVGEDRRAQKSFEKSLTINRSIDNPQGTARQLNNLATLALTRGDVAGARELLQQALFFNREVGDGAGAAINLANLATAAQKTGNLTQARSYLEEARGLARQAKAVKATGQVLCQMAGLALDQQDLAGAAALLAEAETAARTPEVRGPWNYQQGRLALVREETSRAVDFFLAALQADRATLNRPAMGADLRGLGQAWEQRGDFSRAFLYYGRAFDLYAVTNSRERAQQCLEALRRVNRSGGLARSLTLFEQQLETGKAAAPPPPATEEEDLTAPAER